MSFCSHVIMLQRLVALQNMEQNSSFRWSDTLCFLPAESIIILVMQALTFHRCKNLKIRNLMVLNSQQMHLAFTSCMRVVASHLKVLAPAFSPNTDGIHISATKGVEVSNCIIRTGTWDSIQCNIGFTWKILSFYQNSNIIYFE